MRMESPPSKGLCSSHGLNRELHISAKTTMRRTSALLRGAKGYSWYQHYMKTGSEGFKKRAAPTPFDWSKDGIVRPRAFFDISIGNESVGRLEFELAEDVVPKTVDNFKRLCTGDNVHSKSYAKTKFHQVKKGAFFMGGDVENNDGSGSHSAYKERYIADENFIIPHSHKGLLSMASVGLDTGGSQFYLSLSPAPYMNGRCVVFGRLDPKCEPVVAAIEKVFTFRGLPSTDVTIDACGVI